MDDNMIGIMLKKLSNQLSRFMSNLKDKIESTVEGAKDLTGMQVWIINFIDRHEGDAFQKDIEKFFNIRRPTATNILQLMEKNGLIVREVYKPDARLKRLVLTEKAVSIHTKIGCEVKRAEEELTKGLSESELDVFRVIIGKLQQNLAAADSPEK